MPRDPDELSELARLLSRDLGEMTDDELIAAAKASGSVHRSGPERTGRLLAELYRRDRLSWPKIAELTGIGQTTAYNWARPHLPPDEGDERSPRQGRRNG
ncbi:hypothetical protein [Pseudonocardia nigra]|uniref:hypothetical protein n=1 Tax=Pseudonocardia nigra TaxID=1921578 RepID=UPI001C600A6A|nr:hypothetical protein [Pseudonocardia nigra]